MVGIPEKLLWQSGWYLGLRVVLKSGLHRAMPAAKVGCNFNQFLKNVLLEGFVNFLNFLIDARKSTACSKLDFIYFWFNTDR